MLRIVLIRSGCTDFDQQHRIQGSLDLPLCEQGYEQAVATAAELSSRAMTTIYTAPDKAAREMGELIGRAQSAKVKEVESLANLDHGLWHGKLVEEVKQQQPKVYRQWQDHPETVCPPEGETLKAAKQRIQKVLQKIIKKHKDGMVGLVVSEPMATLVQSAILDSELGDLWQGSLNCGQWVVLDVISRSSPNASAI